LAGGITGRKGFEVLQKAKWEEKNMGLGNLGDSLSNLDLGQLTQYLPDLDFPASKDEVVSEVQNNGAPQEVIDQIKNSSNDSFNNANEVLETVRGNR
jgi:predicted nucleotidyltransferase component of viral defense system